MVYGLETSDTRGEGRCYFCVLTYRTDTKHTGKERSVKSETKQSKVKRYGEGEQQTGNLSYIAPVLYAVTCVQLHDTAVLETKLS